MNSTPQFQITAPWTSLCVKIKCRVSSDNIRGVLWSSYNTEDNLPNGWVLAHLEDIVCGDGGGFYACFQVYSNITMEDTEKAKQILKSLET